MPISREQWKIGAFGRLRKSWRYGGRGERLVGVLIVGAPIVGLAIALSVFLVPMPSGEIGVVLVAALMALLGQPIFLPIQYEAVFSPAFWEACIVEGWMPVFEREYYAELARYQRAFGGPTGRLPGDVLWAVSYAGVYLATIVIAVIVSVAVYPLALASSFLAFVPFEIGIAAICFKLYLKRDRARLKLAADRGFQLRELGRAMARSRSAQLSSSQGR